MRSILLISTIVLFCVASSSAQCFSDRHNANSDNSWLSCSPSGNPNPVRGNSHWIQYDLGSLYTLKDLIIWNYNHTEESANGIQNFHVDLSVDGTEWIDMGSHLLELSEGSSFYEGELVTDLNKEAAQYILLTAIDNYGGDCYGFSELKVSLSDVSVPLDLLLFSAVKQSADAQISWLTENEISMDGYHVHRSTDKTNWERVGSVKSENLTEEHTYRFSDKRVFNYLTDAYIYYRLEIVNANGNIEYSEVRALRNDESTTLVSLYPNPASDLINISLGQKIEGNITIDITDITGKLIQRENYNISGNFLSVPLVEQFTNKDYILSAFVDEKLVLQRKIAVFR